MRYLVKEQECGYLLKNGVLEKLLFAGKYHLPSWMGYELKIVAMTGKVDTQDLPVSILMKRPEFAARVMRVQIPDDCIGIHTVNGVYKQVLIEGEALYWNVYETNEVRLVNVTGTRITEDQVPLMYQNLLPARMYKKIVIGAGETGLLYIDGQYTEQLSTGIYSYWIYAHEVTCKIFNLKVQQLEISGQEILTSDKVGIRLNILCSYKITDPCALVQMTESSGKLLYTKIQLLAREYVGQYRLDELLAQKEAISKCLSQQMKALQAEYCVEILDVGDGRGAVLSPDRLAGMTLSSGKVRYYALNPQGEIDILILNDVTGDAYQYGVLTRLDEQGDGMSKFYSYEYDLGGVSYSLPGTTTRFRVNVGPIQIVGDPSNPERMYSLTSTKAGQLAGGQFIAGNQKFTLSDNVLVYEQRDNRYYLSSLNRAEESGKTLTAWYDKAESEGGRIRVIVVK